MILKVFSVVVLVIIASAALAQEISGNFQGGSVKVGYDSATCNAARDGAIRYTSSTDTWEFCTGSAWTPFKSSTQACSAPVGCSSIGSVCNDGNAGNNPDPIFAGYAAINGACQQIFSAQTDQTSLQWKATTGTNDIATDSFLDGQANVAQLTPSNFAAINACDTLSAGGFTDWYLPARAEADVLTHNAAAIAAGGGTFSGAVYWTSTEADSSSAYGVRIGGNKNFLNPSKDSTGSSRCVRRQAAGAALSCNFYTGSCPASNASRTGCISGLTLSWGTISCGTSNSVPTITINDPLVASARPGGSDSTEASFGAMLFCAELGLAYTTRTNTTLTEARRQAALTVATDNSGWRPYTSASTPKVTQVVCYKPLNAP